MSAPWIPPEPSTPVSVPRPAGNLRYQVPSRKRKGFTHTVEIDAYGGNGVCSCMDCATRMEPLLKKGLTGEQAYEMGLVPKEFKPWQNGPEDSLRCFHIIAARRRFTDDVIAAVIKQEKARAFNAGNHAA